MLSGTLPPLDGQLVDQHFLVLKSTKGVFNSKAPKPRYSSICSLDTVLNHLDTLETIPNEADQSYPENL